MNRYFFTLFYVIIDSAFRPLGFTCNMSHDVPYGNYRKFRGFWAGILVFLIRLVYDDGNVPDRSSRAEGGYFLCVTSIIRSM